MTWTGGGGEWSTYFGFKLDDMNYEYLCIRSFRVELVIVVVNGIPEERRLCEKDESTDLQSSFSPSLIMISSRKSA